MLGSQPQPRCVRLLGRRSRRDGFGVRRLLQESKAGKAAFERASRWAFRHRGVADAGPAHLARVEPALHLVVRRHRCFGARIECARAMTQATVLCVEEREQYWELGTTPAGH